MNTNRSNRPRHSAPCAWCNHPRPTAHHLNDSGDLSAFDAKTLGYCPELARLRNCVHPITTWDHEAQRIAAMTESYSADPRIEADELAAAFAAAMNAEVL